MHANLNKRSDYGYIAYYRSAGAGDYRRTYLLEQNKQIVQKMKRIFVLPVSLLIALAVVSCGGQAGGQGGNHDEVHEMEIVPKVKEPQMEEVDTVGFPEESHGTPITGYQGYPEDDLVKESTDEEVAGFAGGADIDYYNGGGSSSDY